ncbi:MAG: hypothetical protein KDA28_10345, partial [Phycisphaerales bacterium]|nr:hypothetical protein [Phycisphaerales bacterium]
MIDLKQLREDPERFRQGAARKNIAVDIDRLVELDAERRRVQAEIDTLRASQKSLAKETGPRMGQLAARLKSAPDDERPAIEAELEDLRSRPQQIKSQIQSHEETVRAIEPELDAILLTVPMPADDDVPVGASADDNVEIRRWAPEGFDPGRTFRENRGFDPKSHLDLVHDLGLADFERGVKLAGSRSYVLTGNGFRLHNAALRAAFDFMTEENGFTPMSVPVIVREEAMVGTGLFPGGRDQAYH